MTVCGANLLKSGNVNLKLCRINDLELKSTTFDQRFNVACFDDAFCLM